MACSQLNSGTPDDLERSSRPLKVVHDDTRFRIWTRDYSNVESRIVVQRVWQDFNWRHRERSAAPHLQPAHVMHSVSTVLPSVLWHCWLDVRKSIRPVKNWLMRCWHCWRGYLSGARCTWFAYGPADGTTTPSSPAASKSRMVFRRPFVTKTHQEMR